MSRRVFPPMTMRTADWQKPAAPVTALNLLKPKLTEMQIQKAVFAHLRTRGRPNMIAWHNFSGGYRKPKEAAIYKGLGVVAGLPDVMVLFNGQLYCLELKSEKGKPSLDQLTVLGRLSAAGAYTCITNGLDRAIKTLEAWGLLK